MKILYATTWFPFPPIFGAKIRAYNLLRELARQHDIALVSFTDAPIEPNWLHEMRRICARVDVVPGGPFEENRWARKTAYFSSMPRSVAASYSPRMAERVLQVATEWRPDCLLAWTYVTAPYVLAASRRFGKPALLDSDNLMTQMLHDRVVNSTNSRQRAWRWLAWRKMKQFEGGLFRQFDLSALASAQDNAVAPALFGLSEQKFAVLPNGIDLTRNPLSLTEPDPRQLVFNGSITYEANYDAVAHFLDDIWPLMLRRRPDLRLRVTGSTGQVDLSRFGSAGNVEFTGFVSDVRPLVAGSVAAIAPLRQGGGTRLKVLEAMALGTPVISSSKGVEGLQVRPGEHVLIADTAEDFADAVVRVSEDPHLRRALVQRARALVEQSYDWAPIGRTLSGLLERLATGRETAPVLRIESVKRRR